MSLVPSGHRTISKRRLLLGRLHVGLQRHSPAQCLGHGGDCGCFCMHGIDGLAPRVAMMSLAVQEDDVGWTSEGPAQMISLRRRSTWVLVQNWLRAETFGHAGGTNTLDAPPHLDCLPSIPNAYSLSLSKQGTTMPVLSIAVTGAFLGHFGRLETLSLSILQPLFVKQRFACLACTCGARQADLSVSTCINHGAPLSRPMDARWKYAKASLMRQ
jgi:hypothetical protein